MEGRERDKPSANAAHANSVRCTRTGQPGLRKAKVSQKSSRHDERSERIIDSPSCLSADATLAVAEACSDSVAAGSSGRTSTSARSRR